MNDKIIEYKNLQYRVLMDNILTTSKLIYPGLKVLLVTGNKTQAVKLLTINYTCNMIKIQVSRIRDGKFFEISHTTNPVGGYLWWIVSFDYILQVLEDKVMNRLTGKGELLEFEF